MSRDPAFADAPPSPNPLLLLFLLLQADGHEEAAEHAGHHRLDIIILSVCPSENSRPARIQRRPDIPPATTPPHYIIYHTSCAYIDIDSTPSVETLYLFRRHRYRRRHRSLAILLFRR